jgi:hypothetical protein
MSHIVIGMESNENLPCAVWKGTENLHSYSLTRNSIKSSMMELLKVGSSECKFSRDVSEIPRGLIDCSREVFVFWGSDVKVSIQEESLIAKESGFNVSRSSWS